MYDLHLHSTYSDGDFSPSDLLEEAIRRGVEGVSLTDHNGIWGSAVFGQAATARQLPCIAGIEVTALSHHTDVHILGYSRAFVPQVLTDGLAATRAGYRARVEEMIKRCREAGYTNLNFEDVVRARQEQPNPSYISYDVAKQLRQQHGLDQEAARRLTVRSGACYVPYGSWALPTADAIALLHQANALAFFAHPGTVAHEAGESVLRELLEEIVKQGIDGIEVYHPFHTPALIKQLETFVANHNLLASGGSDWHGPGRFHDAQFGSVGLTKTQFEELHAALP